MSLSIKYALVSIGLSAACVTASLVTLTSSASACEKGKICDTSGVPTPVLPTNQPPVVTTTTSPTKPNVPTTSGNGTSTVLAPSASQNQQSAATYNNQGGNSNSSAQVIQFGGQGSSTSSAVNGGGENGTIGCNAPFPTINVGASTSNANSNSDNPGFDNQSGSSNSTSLFVSGSIPLGLASARQEQCQRVIDQQIATNTRLGHQGNLRACREEFEFSRRNGLEFNRNLGNGIICPDYRVVATPPVPVVQAPVAPIAPELPPVQRAPRTPEVNLPSTRN